MESVTFQNCKGRIDRVHSQQFGTSFLKRQIMGYVENQDWSDSESDYDFEDSESLQQLFSEKCQIVLPTMVLDHGPQEDHQSTRIDLVHGSQEDHQSTTMDLDHGSQEDHHTPTIDLDHGPREDTQSPTVDLVHGLKEDPLPPTVDPTELQLTDSCNLSKGHEIIQESNSEAAQAYIESPEMKVPIHNEGHDLKSCQDHIDYMHFRLFETNTCVTTLNTTQELEEWID